MGWSHRQTALVWRHHRAVKVDRSLEVRVDLLERVAGPIGEERGCEIVVETFDNLVVDGLQVNLIEQADGTTSWIKTEGSGKSDAEEDAEDAEAETEETAEAEAGEDDGASIVSFLSERTVSFTNIGLLASNELTGFEFDFQLKSILLEQLEGIHRIDVLGKDDHADVWMILPDAVCCLDSFGLVGRGHADVGDHGIGLQPGNGVEQCLCIVDRGNHIDLEPRRRLSRRSTANETNREPSETFRRLPTATNSLASSPTIGTAC